MTDEVIWDLLSPTQNSLPRGRVPESARPANRLPWGRVHIICALMFGIAFDNILRSECVGIGVSLAITIASVGVLANRPQCTRQRVVLTVLALAFGLCLSLRTSAWVVAPTFAMTVTLLLLATSPSRTSGFVRIRDIAGRVAGLRDGPVVFARDTIDRAGPILASVRSHKHRSIRTVRGFGVALPLVAIFGWLLQSGDAVFAKSLSFRVPSLGPLVSHVVLVSVGCITIASVMSSSFATVLAGPPPDDRPRLGITEAVISLASICILFVVFAVVQIVAIVGGSEHVRRTTGLTYAEYARSGFFQLLAVSVLTLAMIGVFRFLVGREGKNSRRMLLLCRLVAVLAFGIVVVAYRRMSLYENAYGLTMRRLVPHIVIVVIGMTFVLLFVSLSFESRLAHLARDSSSSWLVPAVGVVCIVALIGVNVVNLEALVARSQLARSEESRGGSSPQGEPRKELFGLGPDALPTVLTWLKEHPEATRNNTAVTGESLKTWACEDVPSPNWVGWSNSLRRAKSAQKGVCTAQNKQFINSSRSVQHQN